MLGTWKGKLISSLPRNELMDIIEWLLKDREQIFKSFKNEREMLLALSRRRS